MTEACVRGMRNVSKLAALAPRTTRVTQRLPNLSDQSFRYHVPRRIPGIIATASPHPLFRAESPTSCCAEPSPRLRHSLLSPAPVPVNDAVQYCNGKRPCAQQSVSRCGNSFALYASTRGEMQQKKSSIFSQIQIRGFHASPPTGDEVKKEQDTSTKIESSRKESSVSSQPAEDQSQHQHFYERLHMPQFHRPTKEELLAAATGFWSRMKVRFKWATIKSVRPYNLDEIVGFFSWILLGHVLWIVIGTTTFVSLAILAINTVFAQETLAGWIGNYLTKSSGLNVVFESAIVPKWGDGVITFKNVFVSRRPGQPHKSSVTKGSPEAAALAAAAQQVPEEDQNYTQFDITLGEVNVTLSFRKWWNSKGPLQNVEIKHVRGVVDRTHVHWTAENVDPKSYRHQHNPGDFEIESFKIEDLLVTVHQPKGFRPFPVSIYNADLPRLRKHWLFYDMLCANNVTGEFDRSLFTIHPRQTHSFTGAQLNDPNDSPNEPWKKQSRIRLDSLNIDHLNRGVEGPFSWIHEGNVDIVADIMIPNDTDESVLKVMSDFYDRIEAELTSRKHLEPLREQMAGSSPEGEMITGVQPSAARDANDDKRFLVMDLRVHLNDVRAQVPLFTKDLSYINNALIRPIVAYINSRRTFIPINCRVVKRASDFDGSWTVFDSGLMDDLSAEVYEAFARDVTDEQARMRRFKKVGLWSLQLAVQAIFLGMAGNIA